MIFVPDTNVIISAWVFDRRPLEFIVNAIGAGHELVVCPEIVDEVCDVLERPHILRARNKRNFTPPPIEVFLRFARIVKTMPVASGIRDLKDEMILGCAVAAGANCIITGDKDLLVLGSFRNIEILTVADAWSRFFALE